MIKFTFLGLAFFSAVCFAQAQTQAPATAPAQSQSQAQAQAPAAPLAQTAPQNATVENNSAPRKLTHPNMSEFEALAIQDGGRIKPFDTYARESIQLITGSPTFHGVNPTELVLSFLLLPNEWSDKKIVQIKHLELKKDLGIPATESYVSPKELVRNPKIETLLTELDRLQRQKKKLNPYYQAVQRISSQLALYNEIISGHGLKMYPQVIGQDWISLTELPPDARASFERVAGGYYASITKNNDLNFRLAIKDFKDMARKAAPSVYPSDAQLEREIIYNRTHPFRVAFIIYLIAAILFLVSLKFVNSKLWYRTAMIATFAGLAVHVTGFVFRCLIAGRPPVSNMYESIIWVSLGCVVFGTVFELIYRKRYIGLAATSVATVALIIGDSVPAVLDQSIRPLEPVLRSNYWLTIHVLTITLSYAAFALSMGIGNIALSYYARGIEGKNSEKLSSLALFVYRAVQVGVLLLTAGTILGGVWADYSWGRFWGWDPKETWALIADLGYLAVLHGRFAGWFRTFGTVAASVCCFTGVVMAWYGVNFVLGVGLHSYGFGGGGVHYVTGVVIVQLLYVLYAGLRHRKFMDARRAPQAA